MNLSPIGHQAIKGHPLGISGNRDSRRVQARGTSTCSEVEGRVVAKLLASMVFGEYLSRFLHVGFLDASLSGQSFKVSK